MTIVRRKTAKVESIRVKSKTETIEILGKDLILHSREGKNEVPIVEEDFKGEITYNVFSNKIIGTNINSNELLDRIIESLDVDMNIKLER
jgi:hypothetical protein